jgi:hypothetical protein
MKIYGICAACRKPRLFVRRRVYRGIPGAGEVTSQGYLCGNCYRGVKKVIQSTKNG